MSVSHIFIVGSGRAGTTLLARCLNSSRDVLISNQTHFMGHLFRPGFRQEIAKFGSLTDESVIKKVVDFAYSTPYKGGTYWRWLLKNVDKDTFAKKLLASVKDERSLFSALMELSGQNKPILGEKTPGHFFYMSTLAEWYPHAKFVHTIRDPRAIYVSETKFRLNQNSSQLFPFNLIQKLGLKNILLPLYVMFHTTIVWSKVIKLHRQYEIDYSDRYYTLKFETLVCDPENSLRDLCRFLEIEFQPELLDQVVTNTGFKSEIGKKGFDQKAADRWRQHINPVANAWFSFLWKRHLQELGYE